MSRLDARPEPIGPRHFDWGGAVAQMGERCNRTAEVRGSIPLSSTSRPLCVVLMLRLFSVSLGRYV